MLKLTTLNAALTLATGWAEKNLTAHVKYNTALSELYALSSFPLEKIISSDEELQKMFATIEAITSSSLEQTSEWDIYVNKLVDDLAPTVLQHISYAKNTVKPLVIEFAKTLEDYIETYKPKPASAQFELINLMPSELIYDESFLDNLKPYQGRMPLQPDLMFKLNPKTDEELLSFITTGAKYIDEMILKWYSNLSTGFLQSIYTSFFTNEKAKFLLNYSDIDRMHIVDKINASLAIYLLTTKAMNNTDDADPSVNLRAYRETASQYLAYSGPLLLTTINKFNTFVNTNQLIIQSDPIHKKIYVNGPVYNQWLKEGGSPEIILGYLISNDTRTSKEYINTKTEAYLKSWNMFLTLYEVEKSNTFVVEFKEFILSKLFQLRDEPENGIDIITKDYSDVDASYKNNVTELAKSYVDKLSKDELNDIYNISLVLIAQICFYHCSAFNILDDINLVAKITPDVDVREAALVSVINYISDFFASQIELK